MKITTQKAAIIGPLRDVAAVSDPKSPHLAFQCVLVDVTADAVWLRSDNGYQAISRAVGECAIHAPGAIMVRAADLHKRVVAMGDGPIAIAVVPPKTKTAGPTLELKQGKLRYSLPTLDASVAPARVAKPDKGVLMDAQMFAYTLARLAPFASKSYASPSINAIYVRCNGDSAIAMAADGHRVAQTHFGCEGSCAGVTIPLQAATQLARVCGDIVGNVEIGAVGASLHVWSDSLGYTTQLPGDGFPEQCEAVLAMPPRVTPMTVSRRGLASAIKAVRAVDPHEDRLRLHGVKGALDLRARSLDGATAEQLIECDGVPVGVSYVGGYIDDALSFLITDAVTIEQDAGKRALSLTPGDGNGPGALIMRGDHDIVFIAPLAYDNEDLAPPVAAKEAA